MNTNINNQADVQTTTESTVSSSFKEIAMPLVARGIPVIPVLPREKDAFLKKWSNLATTDPEGIEKWNKQNPNFNVGAVAKFGGFWFLDCDSEDLKEQIEKETGQTLPPTFSVRTNRGVHYYWKHNDLSRSLKNTWINDATGNHFGEARVNHLYVVGPGSTHPSGMQYEILNDVEIVEAPSCLIDWVKQQKQKTKSTKTKSKQGHGKIQEGGRNTDLFNQACKLRTAGLSQSDALISILGINKEKCNPPLEDDEVQKLVASAYSYDATHNTVQELIENPESPSATDLGNAERLVAAEGKNIRYCPKNKSWYVWDDTSWCKDESGAILRLAEKTVRAMLHEAADLEDEKERTRLIQHEQSCEAEGRLHAMVRTASWRENVPVKLTDFDTDSMLFNVLNGTIDLTTGNLREHQRIDLISKAAPVNYDSEAKCPIWLQFLNRVTGGSTGLGEYLQTCTGYSLTGQTSEHVLFMLYGSGANGKSSYLETLRFVFGDYSQAADFSTFLVSNSQSARNDIAKLNGARFVTASESSPERRLDETVIKQITGGDTVAARFLYSESFEFTPQCKLWLATNHKPTIRGMDEGVWRRIRPIPFTIPIPVNEQDQTLKEKLREEASGILNWALEGLRQWKEQGLNEPQEVKDAMKEYRDNQDVFGHFLDSQCVIKAGIKIKSRDLYNAYKKWTEETGEFRQSDHHFSNALAERSGIHKVRRSGGVVWEGIDLLASDDDEPSYRSSFPPGGGWSEVGS